MATRKIVPRADDEGGIGTALKRWASAFINALTVDTITINATGTWEAAFVCGTSGTITITPTAKTGYYLKIGKMVFITGRFTIASVSSPVGELTITGLPFTSAAGIASRTPLTLWAENLAATAITVIQGFVLNNATTIVLYKFAAGQVSAMAGDVQASSVFIISGFYQLD